MSDVILERDGEVIDSGGYVLLSAREMAEAVSELINLVASATEAFGSPSFFWRPSRSAIAAMEELRIQLAEWGEAEVRSYHRYQRIQKQIAGRGPRRRKHDGRWAKLSRR